MNDTEIGRLIISLVGDISGYVDSIQKAQAVTANGVAKVARDSDNLTVVFIQQADALKQVQAAAHGAGSGFDGLAASARSTVSSLIAVAGVGGLIATAFQGVQLAATKEQTDLSFEVLLKSAEKAKDVLTDLKRFADTTPFEFPEVTQAAKQMVSVGTSARDIVPVMRMLGDVSSGTGTRLQELVYIYGSLRTQGRAYTQDINQFAGRTIPIWPALATVMKKTEGEVRSMVEEGKIGFGEVEKAFRVMTSAGGDFYQMTERQGQTAAGLWSTMRDSINAVKTTIGELLIQGLSLTDAIRFLTKGFDGINTELKEMPGWLKATLGGVAGLTIAIGAAAAAWYLFGGPVKAAAVAISAVVGGIGRAVVALPGLSAALLSSPWFWWTLAAAAAAVAIRGLATAIANANGDLDRLNRSLERGARLQEEILKINDRRTKALLDYAASEKVRTEEGGEVAYLQKQVDIAKKELAASEGAAAKVRERIDKATLPGPLDWLEKRVLDVAGLGGLADADKAAMADAASMADKARARLKALQDAIADLEKFDKGAWERRVKSIKDYEKELRIAAETAGMSAEQAKAFRIKEEFGATEAELGLIEALELEKRAREDLLKLGDDALERTKAYRDQAETLLMTTRQAELYRLARRGAAAADLETARSLALVLDRLEKMTEMMDRARGAVEQFRTPEEVFAERMNELDEMLNKGAIGFSTYTRAVQAARKELEKANEAMEKIEGSRVGSADALAKVLEYQRRIFGLPAADERARAEGMRSRIAEEARRAGVFAGIGATAGVGPAAAAVPVPGGAPGGGAPGIPVPEINEAVVAIGRIAGLIGNVAAAQAGLPGGVPMPIREMRGLRAAGDIGAEIAEFMEDRVPVLLYQIGGQAMRAVAAAANSEAGRPGGVPPLFREIKGFRAAEAVGVAVGTDRGFGGDAGGRAAGVEDRVGNGFLAQMVELLRAQLEEERRRPGPIGRPADL